MADKKKNKTTPAQKEGFLKKLFWSALSVAVVIITAGRIKPPNNG